MGIKITLDTSLKASWSSRFVFVAIFLSNIFKESAKQQIKFDPGYCLKLSELVPSVAKFFPYFKARSVFSFVAPACSSLRKEFASFSMSNLLFLELAFVP